MESKLKLSRIHRIVEALLFSAKEPLTETQVKLCLGEDNTEFDKIIQDIEEFYKEIESPLTIRKIAQGYKMAIRKEYKKWVARLYQKRGQVHLTKSALETLAIIAYKQPVTRVEIDAIRGVNSDGPMKTLLEKGLIEIRGRKNVPGRPMLYGTTKKFLEYFGLNSLDDLPDIKEIQELNQQSLFSTNENTPPENTEKIFNTQTSSENSQ
ncbi:MAG: SMC-Scp complex subunit ScpB [Candidatus Marinimicrobia bacterium]|nr:SMC-Scp complex subunit ScpB [Candidatus Neomarinimicrobiota bacterium]MCD6101037.1 SMC-Scp complex subunit ScpB [Candidatus Neomarinimicrobiota bacterium]RKY48537.1 MAG: SMC-Scp complex subunit ScpB [Candidatus Neomarinimicrobiota bacterium]HDN59812.1 SMC-Scp complex subunit ScpB [Candidatus Neomarinimicrobiota bacterium]